MLDVQTHNFAPRIGLAYRLGDKTVIRSGYGLYFFNEQGTGGSARLFINYPFAQSYSVSCSATTPCLTTAQGIPNTLSSANLPSAVYIPTATDFQHAAMEFQPGAAAIATLVVRGSYVGSRGNHLYIALNEDVASPGPGAVPPRRPYPPTPRSPPGSRSVSRPITRCSFRLRSASEPGCRFPAVIPMARASMKAVAATRRRLNRATTCRTLAMCGRNMAWRISITPSASPPASSTICPSAAAASFWGRRMEW